MAGATSAQWKGEKILSASQQEEPEFDIGEAPGQTPGINDSWDKLQDPCGGYTDTFVHPTDKSPRY